VSCGLIVLASFTFQPRGSNLRLSSLPQTVSIPPTFFSEDSFKESGAEAPFNRPQAIPLFPQKKHFYSPLEVYAGQLLLIQPQADSSFSLSLCIRSQGKAWTPVLPRAPSLNRADLRPPVRSAMKGGHGHPAFPPPLEIGFLFTFPWVRQLGVCLCADHRSFFTPSEEFDEVDLRCMWIPFPCWGIPLFPSKLVERIFQSPSEIETQSSLS